MTPTSCSAERIFSRNWANKGSQHSLTCTNPTHLMQLQNWFLRAAQLCQHTKPLMHIVKLRKNIEKNSGSAYFFVHLETLDTISHKYGPESEEYNAELQSISCLLQKELVEKISPKSAEETLILLTADHGGVQVNPEETSYLSLDSEAILKR